MSIVIGVIVYLVIGFLISFAYLQSDIAENGEDADTEYFWAIIFL